MSELFGNPEQLSELSGNPEQLPYTPTTEEVRNAFSLMEDDLATEENFQNFDSWLAEVKAQAWEEGLASIKPHLSVWPKQHHLPANPYRQGEEQ